MSDLAAVVLVYALAAALLLTAHLLGRRRSTRFRNRETVVYLLARRESPDPSWLPEYGGPGRPRHDAQGWVNPKQLQRELGGWWNLNGGTVLRVGGRQLSPAAAHAIRSAQALCVTVHLGEEDDAALAAALPDGARSTARRLRPPPQGVPWGAALLVVGATPSEWPSWNRSSPTAADEAIATAVQPGTITVLERARPGILAVSRDLPDGAVLVLTVPETLFAEIAALDERVFLIGASGEDVEPVTWPEPAEIASIADAVDLDTQRLLLLLKAAYASAGAELVTVVLPWAEAVIPPRRWWRHAGTGKFDVQEITLLVHGRFITLTAQPDEPLSVEVHTPGALFTGAARSYDSTGLEGMLIDALTDPVDHEVVIGTAIWFRVRRRGGRRDRLRTVATVYLDGEVRLRAFTRK